MEAAAAKAAAEIAMIETARKWRSSIAEIMSGCERRSKVITRFSGMLK